jgi:hypothetical protein
MGVCVLCRAGVVSGGAGDAAGVASGGVNGGRTGVGAARLHRFAGPPVEFAFLYGWRALVELTRDVVESYRGVWYAMPHVE